MTKNVRNLLLASTAIGLMMMGPAHAADSKSAIKALQAQMNALQKQLNELQAQQKAAAESKPTVVGESGKEILPGVKITLGGFADVTGIYRSSNQSADLATPFSSIPFEGAPTGHQSEFRGSARATRLSLKTSGDVSKDMSLGAYFETDFIGAASTANSVISNSYTPRLRHAFATVDRNDLGFHFMGGQGWSLATMNSAGIDPLKVNLPPVIDVGLVPGAVYDRNVQVRFVKDLADNKVHAGFSLESPQVNTGGVTPPTGVTVTNTGNTGTFSNVVSMDVAPDVIGKLAFDPGWGHYEVFGMTRFFRDNVTTTGHNNEAVGFGGGVAASLPLIKGVLDINANAMAGEGVGRYAAAALPDLAYDAVGNIRPLTQYAALVGAVAHPDPTWTLYTYFGYQKVLQDNLDANGIGYGSTYVGQDNSNCETGYGGRAGTGAATTCNAATSSIWQVTPGFWKTLYKGNYGNMMIGAQYSLTRRNTFADISGTSPHAYQNTVMTTFRYSPF